MFSLINRKRSIPGLTGVEFGADGVSVARVVREAGRAPRVTACGFRPWRGAEDKTRVLAKVSDDFSLKRARCTTVLDPSEYTLLLTEAPDVPADELRSAVRWRIKDLIDFHVDDATIDVFDVTTPNAQGKTRPMYVVAARNASIQRRVDLCDAASVGLDIIDIPELAQRNLASILPEDVRGVVMLVLTAERGLITITRQGEIFLSRRLELGVDTLRAADDPAPYFDQVALEIQRSLDYFDSHFRQAPVDQLVLSPSASDFPALIAHLNQNLNIKVAVMDLAEVLQFDADGTEHLSNRALFALGAALRQEEKGL